MRTEPANDRAGRPPRAPPSTSMNPEYVSLARVDTLRREISCAPNEAWVRTFLPCPSLEHQAKLSRARERMQSRTTFTCSAFGVRGRSTNAEIGDRGFALPPLRIERPNADCSAPEFEGMNLCTRGISLSPKLRPCSTSGPGYTSHSH